MASSMISNNSNNSSISNKQRWVRSLMSLVRLRLITETLRMILTGSASVVWAANRT